jgi:hypothetical protein
MSRRIRGWGAAFESGNVEWRMSNVELNVEWRPGCSRRGTSNSTFFNSTFDIQHLGSEVLTRKQIDEASHASNYG